MTDMISREQADRQIQEAAALLARDITQIAPIILNAVDVERMRWEDNPQVKRGEVPPEMITLSMFEACLRAIADTDACLPRRPNRQEAIMSDDMIRSKGGYEYSLKDALRRNPTIIVAGDDISAVALDRIEELEAKLAKAVEVMKEIATTGRCEFQKVRAALATITELTNGDNNGTTTRA